MCDCDASNDRCQCAYDDQIARFACRAVRLLPAQPPDANDYATMPANDERYVCNDACLILIRVMAIPGPAATNRRRLVEQYRSLTLTAAGQLLRKPGGHRAIKLIACRLAIEPETPVTRRAANERDMAAGPMPDLNLLAAGGGCVSGLPLLILSVIAISQCCSRKIYCDCAGRCERSGSGGAWRTQIRLLPWRPPNW